MNHSTPGLPVHHTEDGPQETILPSRALPHNRTNGHQERKPRKLPAIIVPQMVSKNPHVCRGHKKCVYSLSLRSPVTRRDEVIRVSVAHSGLREKFKGQTTVLWWLKTPGVVIFVFRRIFIYCHWNLVTLALQDSYLIRSVWHTS